MDPQGASESSNGRLPLPRKAPSIVPALPAPASRGRAVLSRFAGTLLGRPSIVEPAAPAAPAETATEDDDDRWFPDALNQNPSLPPNEHPRLRSLWVADVFPPSRLPALLAGLKKHGWDEPRFSPYPSISDAILSARRDHRAWSWRVNRLVPPDPGRSFLMPDELPTELPAGVIRVLVSVHQPIPSVAVLVVYFVFGEKTAAEIEAPFPRRKSEDVFNDSWHGRPPSRRVKRDVDRVRDLLRRRCLEWTASRLPGLFAGSEQSMTAEFITLEEGQPFENGVSTWRPEYMHVLGMHLHGASAVHPGDLRLAPLPDLSWTRAGLLLAGRNDDVAEAAADPGDISYQPGRSVERAEKVFEDGMVFWALWVQLKHYTARFSALRDAVAGLSSADPTAEAKRLVGIQREFVTLLNDAVPFASELRALADDQSWFDNNCPDFRPLEHPLGMQARAPFDGLREQTRAGADHLTRLISEVREVTTTTATMLNAIGQDQATRANLSLQRSVWFLTVVTVLLALLELVL
jgi:hypothetical protein